MGFSRLKSREALQSAGAMLLLFKGLSAEGNAEGAIAQLLSQEAGHKGLCVSVSTRVTYAKGHPCSNCRQRVQVYTSHYNIAIPKYNTAWFIVYV